MSGNLSTAVTLASKLPLGRLARLGLRMLLLPLRPFAWAARHPIMSATVAGSVALAVLADGWLRLPAAVSLVVAVVVWRRVHPSSFAAVRAWVLGGLRANLVYRWRWRRNMTACGLTVRNKDGDPVAPRLVRVISRPGRDELRVRMLPGQTPELYTKNVAALAHSFNVGRTHPEYIDRVTARCVRSGTLVIAFPRADPLERSVPKFDPPSLEHLELEGVPVARLDDGGTYRMPLLYKHVLVAGASGAGKGSVLWSAINALAPGIASGLVQPYGIDPKGGMELALGRGMFARLVYDTGEGKSAEDKAEEMVELVEQVAELARTRAARLAGKTRKHVPTTAEPYVPLFIDELAFLTAYMPYKKLRERFNQALAVVLSQGRAVGVSAVGFLQDPRKEIVELRNLFQLKIALRLDTEEESQMVLGKAAYTNGAHCEAIPMSTPGVGYVLIDGNPHPERVRFTEVTDDDIADLVRTYPSPGVERTCDGHLMPPAPPTAGQLHAVPDTGTEDEGQAA